MSLRDQAEADFAAILASDETESVIRYPKGHSGSQRSVKAIWEPDETPERTESPEVDETVHTGSLHVLSTLETHREDMWEIDDVIWETVARGAVHGGMRTLTLRSVERVQTGRQIRERTL